MSTPLENLRIYFPHVADHMIEYNYNACEFEITLHMDDGSVLVYDDVDHTIRELPNNQSVLTEDIFRNEFGRRLSKLMYRKDFTQQDLADRTEIHQVIISGYIKGKHTPSFYNVCKITKALGCSLEEFRY